MRTTVAVKSTNMPSHITRITNITTKIQHKRSLLLNKLTVLTITLLTVLTYKAEQGTAASLFDSSQIVSSSITAAPVANSNANTTASAATTQTVLDATNAQLSEVLNNSQTALLLQLADSANGDRQRERRKRLRKRHNGHNNNIRLSELAGKANDATAAPEWVNACGGQEVVSKSGRALLHVDGGNNSKYVRKQLNLLTKSLRYENSTVNSLHKIIIDDMHSWRLHSKKYRFLPSLNRTTKIELRHWHRDMQKFVASFAQLGVKQYRWDQQKRQHTSELTRELNALLLSAKRVLCEVENAFNATHPQTKLPIITRKEMQKRLKFNSQDERRVAERGVDAIDLKFAKQRYHKYIQQMFHAVRRGHLRSTNRERQSAAESLLDSRSSLSAQASSPLSPSSNAVSFEVPVRLRT